MLFKRNKNFKIAICGDLLKDIRIEGEVSKISPEVPVPVLLSQENKTELAPGGAANIAHQFRHLNVQATLFGFIDDDDLGLDTSGCVKLQTGFIPKKYRFYDGDFPLLRRDVEKENYGEENIEELRWKVFDKFISRVSEFDCVILSNYSKGFFTESIAQSIIKSSHCPVIVDPKRNLHWWKGCSILKPNTKEAFEMTGIKGDGQFDVFNKYASSTIVTEAGDGFNLNGIKFRPKSKSTEVNSVIGAGDCFTAILSLALLENYDIKDAAKIAFYAGTEYVKNKHNRPLSYYEIYRSVNSIDAKIVSLEDLCFLRNEVYPNRKWIFTNGVFDIMHQKHIEILNYCKSLGDIVVVAVNSDDSVKALKGENRPIHCLEDRMRFLSNFQSVDFVISFSETKPFNIIKNLKPDKICKGGDYQKQDISGWDIVGIDNIEIFPYAEGISTTNLIERIKRNE